MWGNVIGAIAGMVGSIFDYLGKSEATKGVKRAYQGAIVLAQNKFQYDKELLSEQAEIVKSQEETALQGLQLQLAQNKYQFDKTLEVAETQQQQSTPYVLYILIGIGVLVALILFGKK